MTQATPKQKQIIAMNFKDKDQREEIVYGITKDAKRTSTKDLTFEEANQILMSIGYHPFKEKKKFDQKNKKHLVVMNLLHDLEWQFNEKGNQYADLDRLGNWLMSDKRSPVQKRYLTEMNSQEIEKVITALTGILKWKMK